MHIVIAGGSGFLGTALRAHLAQSGHTITQLVRGEPSSATQVQWNPSAGRLDPAVLDGADAVVNLAGAPLVHVPMTASYRRQIIDSRVSTTTTLADAVAARGSSTALVNASGINYYGGDRGDELVDEDSAPGTDFLADVCKRWEDATSSAQGSGARVAVVRTSVVLDKSGGALKPLLLPFRLGVGGRLGSGRQWFPSVSMADYLAAVTRLITDSSMSGPFNVVAPVAATNTEFTAALGARVHRPARLTVPPIAIKTALGEVAGALVGGVNAVPRRLLSAEFEFAHPTIERQLDAALA